MSAVDGGVREVLTGLTLNDILGTAEKQAAPATPAPLARSQSAPGLQPQLSNLTLMDVIREQDPNARSSYEDLLGAHHNRDKKYWKNFKHKLSLKRAGANWTSSIRIPASDIPIRNTSAIGNSRSSRQLSFARVNSVRYPHSAESTHSDDNSSSSAVDRDHSSSSSAPGIRPQISRLSSTRLAQSKSTHPGDPDSDAPPDSQLQSFGRQMSRHNSTRYLVTLRQNSMYNNDVADFAVTVDGDEEGNGDTDGTAQQATTRRLSVVLAEERSLSAREAVAAQEAAEAAAAAAAEREQTEAAESSESQAEQPPVRMSLMDLMDYNMADDEEEEAEEKEEEEEVVEKEESESGGVEHKCCVCMVRHKGAAFIPCGHTFCRLCSRELMVGRGNCPLCNRFITEILDIF